MLSPYGIVSKTECSNQIKLNNMNIFFKSVLFAGLVMVSSSGLPVEYAKAGQNWDQGTITLVATKVVCNDESLLPNWGAGGFTITESTVANFLVDKGDSCFLEEGWHFQWAQDDTSNPGDNTGVADNPWTTFGPTDSNGRASTLIDLSESGSEFWVREVFQNGYLGFSGVTTTENVSAEMYCNVDVYHYDNIDLISDVEDGGTYYCVAFNVNTAGEQEPAPDPEPEPEPEPETSPSAPSAPMGSSKPGSSGTYNQALGRTCGLYMDRFIRSGRANDVEQVVKLQTFLNQWMGSNLPITGFYDASTLQAVNIFQTQYADQILTPWGLSEPTGIVYLTTLRQINLLECSSLMLGIPTLVAWSSNPNTPSELETTVVPSQGVSGDESEDENSESNQENQSASVIRAKEGIGKFINFLKRLFRR